MVASQVTLDGFNPDLLESAAAGLGTRDAHFLKRIYADGLAKYRSRLQAIDFEGLGHVLDAGCGFGQWSLALAATCARVTGVDFDRDRIRVAGRLAEGVQNASFQAGSIEALEFPDETFDAVFCFSAIYYTRVERTVSELARVLRPGGRIYLCSNGVGWYLYNVIRQPYASADFSPRAYGLRTFRDTVAYRLFGAPPTGNGSVITSRRYLARLLQERGIRLLGIGGEGTLRLRRDAPAPRSFFRESYLGLECVSEWVGVKLANQGDRA